MRTIKVPEDILKNLGPKRQFIMGKRSKAYRYMIALPMLKVNPMQR